MTVCAQCWLSQELGWWFWAQRCVTVALGALWPGRAAAKPCAVSLLLSCCGFGEPQCKALSEGGCGEPRKNSQRVVRRCGPLSTENPSSSEVKCHWLHLTIQ